MLNFLTSYINYGGRVTDYIDLRTIDVLMRTFYTPRVSRRYSVQCRSFREGYRGGVTVLKRDVQWGPRFKRGVYSGGHGLSEGCAVGATV